MYPCVFGRFHWKPPRFQSLLFALEICKSYLECNVVNGGSGCIRPPITGAL